MKEKSENDNITEYKKMVEMFEAFNDFIVKVSEFVEYPFSKEIYGIESRNYKFQMSIAMILAGIYKKPFASENPKTLNIEDSILKIKENLSTSFLEDPDYKASSTNSQKLDELINNF